MGAAEDLHAPFDEAEAARRLGVSKATLMRERAAGKIHPMRIGKRVIRYTESILNEYREACRNVSAKSATSGSAKGRVQTSGAEPGSTPILDKRDAHRLAQTIFKRPS
ncbi:helix-turn-helix domain-containing protein [Luteibacter sp.]|uniref:helix-turn-helix domain-containing protein n=1 Tax=Luteibacter sp. TaxID=1886636 RepID=UPI0025C4AC37|nr:helix-turn-helix domain-containing protein [Luteibacter sp.]